MKRGLASGAFVLVVWIATLACGDDAEVTKASCEACAGKSYTEADCKRAGEAAGCETSTFLPTVAAGCTNGCSFEKCRTPPECSPPTPSSTPDSGTKDAAVDPACAQASKGLFPSTPPCADSSPVTINGNTQYTCSCGQACPCGFQCGSIALPSGGTLSNVCAPP